jgi:hypothetical protein
VGVGFFAAAGSALLECYSFLSLLNSTRKNEGDNTKNFLAFLYSLYLFLTFPIIVFIFGVSLYQCFQKKQNYWAVVFLGFYHSIFGFWCAFAISMGIQGLDQLIGAVCHIVMFFLCLAHIIGSDNKDQSTDKEK